MTTSSYRELTPAAIVLGIVQGVVLNLAFVYAALKLGFSIGGSTVAAIMGYVFLRVLMKKGSSIENNINQTIASGINTTGTGIVFTVPALFMLNASLLANGEAGIEFSAITLTMGAVAGAILGVIFIIPLRKQMIELDRLRFPTGLAVATIIRSGSSGLSKAKLLGIGFLVSATWKLVMISGMLDSPGLLEHEELKVSFGVLPDYMSPYLYLSLMNIAAGMIAGRGGLPFFFGGLVAFWCISPLTYSLGWTPNDAGEAAGFIYSKMLRPLGIGCLIGGALMGVVMAFPAIKSALRSLSQASKTAKAIGDESFKADELPLKVVMVGTLCAVVLFIAASFATPGVTPFQAIFAAIIGTIWLGVAGLIVAQATGMTDISPMSGMALISVTLMMFLYQGNIAAAMIVGVAVCVAVGLAADTMQDLKTGFLLGARPIKQQIAQLSTSWIGAFVGMGAIYLLWSNGVGGQGGFGEGTPLPAPQAGALTGIIATVKSGVVPIDKYIMGGIAGAILTTAPIPGVGVLVGLAFYLPFSITLGYGLGCLLQMYIQKRKGVAFSEHKLIPLAAGLIVGEALMGIGHSLFEIIRAQL